MLDKWFQKDLKKHFKEANKIILQDENKEYDFLIENISRDINARLFKVDDYLSDLEVKYRVEKEHQNEKVLIHSILNFDKNSNRQYMIQEYCATGEVFDRHLARYIKEKSGLVDVDQKLSNNEIILAGKMSLREENSNQDFWKNIKMEGKKALFGEFADIVLKFLAEPKEYIDSLPEGGRQVLYQLLGKYMEIEPDKEADPEIVASDFANIIFDNIIKNNHETEDIYKKWLDSYNYREYLRRYLSEYELPEDIELFQVNANHPFLELDNKWLNKISDIILNNEDCPDHIMEAIKNRYLKKEGREIAGSNYWEPVYKLIKFQEKPAHKIEDINEFIEQYKNNIYQLDQVMRHINQHLLDKPRAQRAFKALYEEKINPYLKKWFELFSNYRENQVDYLAQEVFSDGENKAVILGDALSFEVTQEIIKKIDDDSYNITNKIFNGDYPTTTVNNMSSLFNSMYTNQRSKREESLVKKLNKKLQVDKLDNVDIEEMEFSQPTILYSRDIDELSEKGDESALKYYPTFINSVVDKTKALLDKGFREVHLLTDHGFVCNFNIDEADKYSSPVEGKINERYILSNEYNNEQEDFIIKEKNIEGYNYVYFPKGINPIKSKSSYGFAHGGITPQEILLPHITFKKESSSNLEVNITNKEQLKSISSRNITIKIEAETGDLFKQARDIILRIDDKGQTKMSQEMTIKPDGKKTIELSLSLNKYTIILLDKASKEVLDSIKGKKEDLRSGLDDLNID